MGGHPRTSIVELYMNRQEKKIGTRQTNNIPKKRVFLSKQMYRKKFFRNNLHLNLAKHCFIYVKQTLNNTFVTVKNKKKRLLVSRSCGSIGFKGPQRSTHYASVQLGKKVKGLVRKSKKTATVILLSRPTKQTKLLVANLAGKYDLKIKEIVERIPIPHNGMRMPHLRRK